MRGGWSTAVLLVALAACGDTAGDGSVAFSDVTEDVGLPTASGGCLAFRDFDDDGRPDLLLAPFDAHTGVSQLALYRNLGEAGFEKHDLLVTGAVDCAVSDLDRDGLLDVVVPRGGEGLAILRGLGGLDFSDDSYLVHGLVERAEVVVVIDYDRDGWPDLVVGEDASPDVARYPKTCDTGADFQCHLAGAPPGKAPLVLHNKGRALFEHADVGLSVRGYITGFNVVDWDDDGFPDLFQCNDFGQNELYRNDGGARFTGVLQGLGGAPYNHAMGAALDDFDGDGHLDLFVADAGPAQLFYGSAEGALRDVNTAAGLSGPTALFSGWSPAVADFDNDGLLDLVEPNTAEFPNTADMVEKLDSFDRDLALPARSEDFVFMNAGAGKFRALRLPHRTMRAAWGRAASAVADFDGDGRLDAAISIGTIIPEFRLLRNESDVSDNHFLVVRLVPPEHRDPLGASVSLLEGGRVVARRAIGGRTLGGTEATARFGLGPRTKVEALRVRWPDGTLQDVPGPFAVDRVVTVAQAR